MEKQTYLGTVVHFKKNYGFIKWEKNKEPQQDMFVHFSDINSEGYKILKVGDKVTFELGTNHQGQPKAVNVTKQD